MPAEYALVRAYLVAYSPGRRRRLPLLHNHGEYTKMRRFFALTAITLTLALAGCSRIGTAGHAAGDWPAMPSVGPAAPAAVGSCHYFGKDRDVEASLPDMSAVVEPAEEETRDCVPADASSDTVVHDTETVYVGEFTGVQSAAPAPPGPGTAARKDAYARCLSEADGYLGGDWHQASVWIMLVLPSDAAWRSGAHWYRCDAGRTETPASYQPVMRGSLRDGLAGERPLAITCLITNENADGQIVYSGASSCDKPHAAEYAGHFIAPAGAYPGDDTDAELDGCASVVARYLGFRSVAAWDNDKIGTWALPFDKERWELGDRSTRCFAYAFTASKVIIGSVKDIRRGTPRS